MASAGNCSARSWRILPRPADFRLAVRSKRLIGGPAGPPILLCGPLLRNLPKGLADREYRVPDQARILDAGLAMLARFPVDRIAGHFREPRHSMMFRK